MDNKAFGMILRKLRTAAELSVKEVTDRLSVMGIELSEKTLYGYEKGIRMPNADMLIYLCQIYRCSDILSAFTGKSMEGLTYPETQMLTHYRSLDSHGRSHVDTVLGWEAERVQLWEEKLRGLSDTVVRFARDETGAAFPRPAADADTPADSAQDPDHTIAFPSETRVRTITYLQRMASAGSGEFLFDDLPTDTIQIKVTPQSEHADFVIGVNGDSMEPTYSDGDMVLVEKTPEIHTGEIGIFIRGGDCFIKEAGENRLISHNKNYPDIPPSGEIRVVGRVLGRIET